MSFWQELRSADNTKTSTPYVILLAFGTILMFVSIVLIIYHCFYHGHGIDKETVTLILGLFGGGVINAGASYFGRPKAKPLEEGNGK
jgi:hypothetical protein